MTKKHALKNVIPRLDRGIQGFFNLNTKDTKDITNVPRGTIAGNHESVFRE